MCYEVIRKITTTLVQLKQLIFNETKRTATKFEGLEKRDDEFEQFEQIYWLSSAVM